MYHQSLSQPCELIGQTFENRLTLDVSQIFGALTSVLNKFAQIVKAVAQLNGQNVDIDIDVALDEIKKAESEIKKLGDADVEITPTVNTKGVSDAFKGGLLGSLAEKGLSAIATGFSDAIRLGSEFETGMASLSAVTGAVGPGLQKLGDDARSLALKFGGSASEQIGVFQTTLSKIGPQLADSPEQLAAFADSVNILGKTDAALGAAGAVDALTTSMLQFKVNVNDANEVASEASRFANVLAASAAVGSASVSQVSDAIAVTGAVAKNSNQSIEETAAGLQVLASKSLVGAQAGTAYATVLNKLTAQSKEGDDALKALGTSSAELGTLLNEKGIGASMEKLREAMGKLGTDAEKNALLNKLFGESGQNAAAALLGSGDMLKQFTAGVTGTTAATDQAAINMNTVAERISRITAVVQDKLIGAFQAVAPIVNSVIDGVSSAFDDFGPAIITAGVAVGVFAVAMGASAIATGVASAATAVWGAVMAANPIGAIIAGVVLLTAGIIALADALGETAEEQQKATESQIEATKSQIADNNAKKAGAAATAGLVAEFKELASKTSLTAKEQERMRVIQDKLDQQYPDLIDQTKSFRDNLDGVEKAGQAVTASMEGLNAQGLKLAEQLKEQSKLLAFVKRNVELEKLENVFGFFDGQGLSRERNEAVAATKREIQKFKDAIGKAQNEEQSQAAASSIREFLNKNVGQLEEYGELSTAVEAALSAQLAAIRLAKGQQEITAPKVDATPPPKPPPKKDDDDKKGKTELALAQAELQRREKLNAAQLASFILGTKERLQKGEILKSEKELLDATEKQRIATLNLANARELLKVDVDAEGFVTTRIRPGDSETANQNLEVIREAFQSLTNSVKSENLNVIDIQIRVDKELLDRQIKDASESANRIVAAKFFEFDDAIVARFVKKGVDGIEAFNKSVQSKIGLIDLEIAALDALAQKQDVESRTKTEDTITKLREKRVEIATKAAEAEKKIIDGVLAKHVSAGDAIAAAFSGFTITIDNEDANAKLEETRKKVSEVNKEFKAGTLSYQSAIDKMKEAGETTLSFFDRIAQGLATSFSSVSDALSASSIKAGEASGGFTDAVAIMGASVGASFAGMALAGEDVWTAIAKSAFDGLQALVPILSAQILAVALAQPTSVITGGGEGFVRWGLLTAAIQTAVAGARAAAGFKSGGPTGEGNPNDIAGVVHKREWVANEQNYKTFGPVFDGIHEGKIRNYTDLAGMLAKNGIVFPESAMERAGISREQLANFSMAPMQRMGAIQLPTDTLNAMHSELVGIKRQLAAMDTLQKTAVGVDVTLDTGLHAKMTRRAAIRRAGRG